MAVPEERPAEAVRRQVTGVFDNAPPLAFVPASGARARRRREVDSRAIGGLWAAAFGVSSLGIALVTLLPGRTAGLYTDGAQILRYVRGGQAMERHSASWPLPASRRG